MSYLDMDYGHFACKTLSTRQFTKCTHCPRSP